MPRSRFGLGQAVCLSDGSASGAGVGTSARSEAIGVAGGAGCVRLGVGLHLFDLRLEDPHRLTERSRRVRELLGTEEQHEYGDND